MTNEEFSIGFDSLVDSYRRFKDFDKQEMLDSIEFSEYDKSLYLTRAQEKIVVGLYNGQTYPGHPFENTEELTDYLAQLVSQKECVGDIQTNPIKKVFPSSTVYKMPDNMLFRTLEVCTVTTTDCGSKQVDVVPVTQDEVLRTFRNPFKKQNARRVLRLTYGGNSAVSSDAGSNIYSELISDFPITSYIVRYLRRPNPIVLEDMPDGISINGVSVETECELNPVLHSLILESAVQLALLSKRGNAN